MEGYIGEIKMFGGTFAPTNWALCQGQLLAISQNTALFSILGTTYGGNGVNNFALPDFRGRVPVGTGQGPGLSYYDLGQTGGVENTTLLTSNMPAHVHAITLNCSSNKASSNSPAGNYLAVTEENPGYHSTQNATMGNSMTGPSGNNLPFSILQPYLGINFIICLNGIFPSRP